MKPVGLVGAPDGPRGPCDPEPIGDGSCIGLGVERAGREREREREREITLRALKVEALKVDPLKIRPP